MTLDIDDELKSNLKQNNLESIIIVDLKNKYECYANMFIILIFRKVAYWQYNFS